jgi:hypothetical protein
MTRPAGFYIDVSPNGRYFTDPQGAPWFFLGDTLWELFRMYSRDDVEAILDTRIAQGFNAFLVMLNGVPEGGNGGLPGDRPWEGGTPPGLDESYFAHVDSIVDLCSTRDAVFIVGVYHKSEDKLFTPSSARAYARAVADRYKHVSNIVWCMYPEASSEYTDACREIAAGLKEGAGHPLITIHPDPAPASSSFFGDEPWLAFNMLQVCVDYDRIHRMIRADYDLPPARPAVMAEGGYEGIEFGKTQDSHAIRKQAYWSHFAGGHHVYGHNSNYAQPLAWRSWIDSEGAGQLHVYRRIITSLDEWWTWVPDQTLIGQGAGQGAGQGMDLNVACRAADWQWAMVYLSGRATVSVNLGGLGEPAVYDAKWIDPRTGTQTPLAPQRSTEAKQYTTPADWEDAVMVFTRTQSNT